MNSILITGCNRGLGLGLIKTLLSVPTPPAHVFATCRNLQKAEELQALAQQHQNLHIIQFDTTDFSSYDRVTKEVENVVQDKGLNVLFNNAGVASKSTRLLGVRADDFTKSFLANTTAPIMLTKAFHPLLKKSAEINVDKPMGVGRAAVINMSSILGSIGSNAEGGMYSYRASKSALNAATKSMSIDFKDSKILCVSLHPGWVKTDMGGKNAPLEIDSSCKRMVETIMSLNESNNGTFLQFDGTSLPW